MSRAKGRKVLIKSIKPQKVAPTFWETWGWDAAVMAFLVVVVLAVKVMH